MANDTAEPAGTSTSAAGLGTGRWTLDADASAVGFRHRSMWGLITMTGTFARISGEGTLDADGSGRGTLVVDAGSVDTTKKRLDTHLLSADFFDVGKHPDFTFEADGVVADGAGNAEVTGRLTVLGRTRPLAFTARITSTGADDVTLTGEVHIDRNDFGMAWKNPGGMMRGLTVVTLRTRFTRA
jgi:polyisoprenoid-binding protein YceI